MRVFYAADERTPKTEDSLAERVEFELTSDERVIPTLVRRCGPSIAVIPMGEPAQLKMEIVF